MPSFPSDPDETPPYAKPFKAEPSKGFISPRPSIVCTGFRVFSNAESDYLCRMLQSVTLEIYPPGRQKRSRLEPFSGEGK